jgi:hypothetical protein
VPDRYSDSRIAGYDDRITSKKGIAVRLVSSVLTLSLAVSGLASAFAADEKVPRIPVPAAVRSASSAATGVADKADKLIRGGLQKGSQSADSAAKAADGPVDRAAKKIGLPRGPASPTNTERGN